MRSNDSVHVSVRVLPPSHRKSDAVAAPFCVLQPSASSFCQCNVCDFPPAIPFHCLGLVFPFLVSALFCLPCLGSGQDAVLPVWTSALGFSVLAWSRYSCRVRQPALLAGDAPALLIDAACPFPAVVPLRVTVWACLVLTCRNLPVPDFLAT